MTIKSFYGNSDNAVRTQVWITISVYVLVAIVKKELGVEKRLSEILPILRLSHFAKTSILRTLSDENSQDPGLRNPNRLPMLDL